jgi:flagellar hook-length control protein FliK
MPNDVSKSIPNTSIANLFSDLAPSRRPEKRGGGAPDVSPADPLAAPASFGQLVAKDRRAGEPRRANPPAFGRSERLMPGRIGEAAREAAQHQRRPRAEDAAAKPPAKPEIDPKKPKGCSGVLDDERPACRLPAVSAKDSAKDSARDTGEDAVKTAESSTNENPAPMADVSNPDADAKLDETAAIAIVEAPAVETRVVADPAGGVAVMLASAASEASSAAVIAPQVAVAQNAVPAAEGDALNAGGSTGLAVAVAAADAKAAKAEIAAEQTADPSAETAENPALAAQGPKADGAQKRAEALAAFAGDAKLGSAEKASAASGDVAASKSTQGGEISGEKAEAKPAQPNLHPARAAPLRELLEGFTHPSAIHRPADILAGLDRSVAAQAVQNRGHDIQRPTPLQMLPIEIGMQAVRGVTQFQIRLDPAELGRVDVNLQISDKGEVQASLVVDRVETLAMLKRDASTLQYAFEQAGLRQSADGLTFSLRGENQQGQQQGEGRRGPAENAPEDFELRAEIGEIALRRALIPHSSVDLMV